jgi:hypothetical protein
VRVDVERVERGSQQQRGHGRLRRVRAIGDTAQLHRVSIVERDTDALRHDRTVRRTIRR